MPVESLVKMIQDCEAMCEHTMTHVSMLPDVHMRVMQLHLLHDCADICGLTAKFVARNSVFARATAGLCACICEVCGAECAKYPDPASQACAQMCLHCAKACRAFAMM
jgi:hypothetical protein